MGGFAGSGTPGGHRPRILPAAGSPALERAIRVSHRPRLIEPRPQPDATRRSPDEGKPATVNDAVSAIHAVARPGGPIPAVRARTLRRAFKGPPAGRSNLVGGWVRDAFLLGTVPGREPLTSATPAPPGPDARESCRPWGEQGARGVGPPASSFGTGSQPSVADNPGWEGHHLPHRALRTRLPQPDSRPSATDLETDLSPAGLHRQRPGDRPAGRPALIDPFGGLDDLRPGDASGRPSRPKWPSATTPLADAAPPFASPRRWTSPSIPDVVAAHPASSTGAWRSISAERIREEFLEAASVAGPPVRRRWGAPRPRVGPWRTSSSPSLPAACGWSRTRSTGTRDVFAHTLGPSSTNANPALEEEGAPTWSCALPALLHGRSAKPKNSGVHPGGRDVSHHHEVVGPR